MDKISIKKAFDELKSPLFSNAFFLMLTTFSSSGSGFIFWFIAAKYYSPENVGLAVAVISAIGILNLFARLGLDIGIIRYLPESDKKDVIINSCLTVISIMAIALSVLFIFNIDLFSPTLMFMKLDIKYASLFIVFTLAYSVFVSQANIFAALRNTKYSFVQNLVAISRVLMLPFLIKWGLLSLFLSYGAGIVIATILGNYFITKVQTNYRPSFRIDKKTLKNIFSFSFANYIATIFEGMPTYILPLIVLDVLGAEQNAYFYIAWSFSAIFLMIPRAIATSLFAEGSYEPSNFSRNIVKSLKFVMIALVPGVLLISALGRNILNLFGETYSTNAFDILILFCIASLPYTINVCYLTAKRIEKNRKAIILINFSLSSISILLAYLLMQSIGLIGVGIAWCSSNLFIATIIFGIYIQNHFKKRK